jgi:branched-subunit amino acid aminotransferase/4-amino-4-deoxychorismate lyase
MIFNLLPALFKTGADVFLKRQETKRLQASAERNMMAKMASGELEYKAQVLKSNDQGIKDDIVLLIVILPIVILAWSIFSGDDQAKEKLDLFFHYFNNFPEFYKWLILGIFGSIYGLKPGMDLVRNKKK